MKRAAHVSLFGVSPPLISVRMSGLRRVYIPKLMRTTLGDAKAVVVHVAGID